MLLLGTTRSALAAARDLSAAGWDVGVGRTPPGDGLAGASRAVRYRDDLPSPQADLEVFADRLRRLVEARGYDVVLPTADEHLCGLSLVRTHLPARVPLAPHRAVECVLDKVAIEPVARAAGFRVPETSEPTDEVLRTWGTPLIVKDRSHWNPGSAGGRIETVLADSQDELIAAVARIRAAGGQPTVQRVLGGRMHCAAAFRAPDGTVSGHVHQTSAHLWPVPVGMTARATTVPVDPDLATRVAALLDQLEWVGSAFLQLFRQPDGTDVLIDVNGRFHHSLALAVAAGVHYPRAWAAVARGQDAIRLPDGRPGVHFSFLPGDARRALRERRGGLSRDLLGTGLFALRAHHTVLSWSDPRPALHSLAAAARRSWGAP